MNPTLEQRLRQLTRESLRRWVDEGTASRGKGYRNRVGEIVSVGDSIAAKVRGTDEYTTNVFVDDSGNLASVCTCPVGRNCKHGVALALRAAEALKAGKTFPDAPTNGWMVDRKAVEQRLQEREREAEERRRQREEERTRERRMQEEREAAEAEAFRLRKASFAAMRDRMLALREARDFGGTLHAVDELLSATDDDFFIHSRGNELFDLVDEALVPAIETIAASDMKDVEKILWSHDAGTPYRYCIDNSRAASAFWPADGEDDPYGAETWSAVGDALRKRLDDPVFVDACGYHALIHHVGHACDAFWRAGRGEDAFALRRRFAAKTDGWGACADELCRLGRRDEAKAFLLAIRAGDVKTDSDDWIDGHDLLDKVADILEQEGDFRRAAAVRAENWLARVGGIDACGNDWLLQQVLDTAGKAGCRAEVRTALFHAVDTRTPPVGMATHEPAFPASRWRLPVPPFVSERPPHWPLPPSGLAIAIPTRLFDIEAHWCHAEAMLARMALAEGDRADAARRFLALPAHVGGYGPVSPEDHLNDLERTFESALSNEFPEVAARIAANREARIILHDTYSPPRHRHAH